MYTRKRKYFQNVTTLERVASIAPSSAPHAAGLRCSKHPLHICTAPLMERACFLKCAGGLCLRHTLHSCEQQHHFGKAPANRHSRRTSNSCLGSLSTTAPV